MFTRVLVGVDGEQGGRDAIALAKQLGGPEASIALAHVYGAGLMPGAGAALLLGAELEESERLLEYARRAAAPGAQLISCADHSIGRALHLLAEEQGFDLIVIGACRHGFIGRRLVGNDTIAVLNGAPCPIAVAPHRFAEHPHDLVSLGVGYDGSPESERALEIATRLRSGSNSTVLTLGEPSEDLASFGEQVDLLIVGLPGSGPAGRLRHGSPLNRLARDTPCPLLVIPLSGAKGAAAA
ncbi:MAG TPA: universal stress protein [Solirubrobacteraceae bacterium]|nr:universal stress protein [Solirubrobacteraceae bacterium]